MTEALQQEIRTLKTVFESDRDPAGRVFAPLADAYRRAGEIQQAVRLLNEGLARHPDFVPGHVVAAQLYVEQGLSEEAAIAARQALALDGENVNALRSLLRVLEERSDDEADEVRARLVALEPEFKRDENGVGAAGPPAPASLPEIDEGHELEATGIEGGEAAAEAVEVDSEADTLELRALGGEEPPALQPTAAVDAIPADLEGTDLALTDALATEAGGLDDSVDEPLLDLDSLGPLDGTVQPEVPQFEALDSELESGMELDVEEPVVDLDSLAPVSDEVDTEDLLVTSDAGLEPAIGLPTEEPVVDLADLAPADAGSDEAEEVVSLADLAPDPGAETVPLPALAGEEDEEPVMELTDLAPDETAEEPVMDLADLAPGEAADEPVMELADLAPEEEAEEPVMELTDLAPDETDEEPVMELTDLAPDEAADEPTMELAALAPDPADEAVVDLDSLAPDEGADDETLEISALAPEPDAQAFAEPEEPVAELADLAPDEAVVDLDSLAPDADEEQASDQDVTMLDLMAQAPESTEELEARGEDHEPVAEEPEDEAEPEAVRAEGREGEPEDDALEADEESPGEPVYTRTLAELYVKQGAIERAIEVYRHLRERRPEDESLSDRLAELEAGEGLEHEAEPVLGGRTEEEVETLARELAENGDDGPVELESPYTLHEGEVEEPAEEAAEGPTIGDYFEDLLNWKPEKQA